MGNQNDRDLYGFNEVLHSGQMSEALGRLKTATPAEVATVLAKLRLGESLTWEEGAVLLSEAAADSLEVMAQHARRLSLNHFGKSVLLYTPIYLSNYCINQCRYCNYGAAHAIRRRALTSDEMIEEAKAVAGTGLKQVLLLTGESDKHFDFSQICHAVNFIKPFFDTVSIESYALTQQEYSQLEQLGVYGVTLYQETYDPERYAYLHPVGPKSDYAFRLGVPQRVGSSGLRQMSMGVLMGLSDWREDVLKLMAHGAYIQKHYPELELSFALPRMIEFEGSDFGALGISGISDAAYVQAICALRLVLPQFGISLSTRETADMRRALLPIGINKLSAGVSTEVGGHIGLENKGDEQFKIADDSSVAAVRQMVLDCGYQPIMRDWINF